MESVKMAWAAVADALGAQRFMAQALYVVATPIGNLADISARAIAALAGAELIAAEDTRHTRALLNKFGVNGELIACHEHNEREAAERVVAHLAAGGRAAYVSDAGTPAISDPGAKLVDIVRAAGYPIVPIPGPSALITALSAAGTLQLPGDQSIKHPTGFHFAGFLPSKAQARSTVIASLNLLQTPIVFYEAPHRIADTVHALADQLTGPRTLLIARELTKLHEQLHCCALSEASAWLAADPNHQRGEFVLVVSGHAEQLSDSAEQLAIDTVLQPLLAELPLKQAVNLTVAITHLGRNIVYARALALKQNAE